MRRSTVSPRLLAAVALALGVGCGIKGPLRPPPEEPAAASSAPPSAAPDAGCYSCREMP